MLESYFKSEDEKAFVQREIDKITLCNEFAEMYLTHVSHEFSNDHKEICSNCGEEVNILDECDNNCEDFTVDTEYTEVFQWFLVDSYLAGKLEEIGEPVLHTDSHTLWGRTCCGQSVELDGTFQEIYQNLNK